MIAVEEKAWIAERIDGLRSQLTLQVDPARRGPVRLGRFLEEHELLHVSLPGLSRATVFDFLMSEGISPGDLGTDEKLAGFLFVFAGSGYVFVNQDDFLPRRRFTAAHELGHFILHRTQMSGRFTIGDTDTTVIEVGADEVAEMERQANRFAAELLMPAVVCRARAEAFRHDYRTCPRSTFAYHLAAELLVSPEAMRHRLRELEVGDD